MSYIVLLKMGNYIILLAISLRKHLFLTS
uniref:Uncharacterized protein n=1 Tax=Anguilla anguilla TaxID=7936 RepID=A0A0E9VB01_ANGAN